MTDTMTTQAEAKDHSYDGLKSGRRVDGAGSVEVRVRAERRRPWPDDDKLRIVRETLVPGAVEQAVADRHGVSTDQLYTWRKQMLAMAMSGFTPVEVRQEALPAPTLAPASEATAPTATGDLQVVLPGGAEVRFSGSVTPGLRGIAVTRKNFLFLGSDGGGERAAIIYTIAETAKLNGHNPEAYIAMVLDRLAKGHLASRINDLLPWKLSPDGQPVGDG